jgi:hypothetical protein
MENHEPRDGYLAIVYAWCGQHLRWEWQGTDHVSPYGHISHTICPHCAAQAWKELGTPE